MTTIDLAEHGPPRSVPLAEAAGRALLRSGVVDAAPDPDVAGQWRVRAKNLVGVAAIGTSDGAAITVRVAPKIPIARLLFLLGYSRIRWRTDHVLVGEHRDLLPAFAQLFTLQAEQSLRQGLLKGYREVEETALVMRGRVRHADQVSRQHGRLIPLELTHDEYTTDIAENRLLRTACDTLLRLPGTSPGGIPADVRGRLLRLRAHLGDLTPVPRGHPPPTWRPTRLNARYHDALRLAGLVLRGASVEHRPGDVTVHGFLFDLAKVFEDFVTAALRDALAGDGDYRGHCVLQATHHLDESNAIRIVPDLVAYAEDGTPLAVADTKYKAEQPAGFPDADLYQMLAYCTALNLREGHLIYAKGNAPHGSHRVKHAGVTIHQHALDLDRPPGDLLRAISLLARRLGTT
ncbi:5-methylcytosine-specific restriction enzyme subunit McrC [Prauserella shujinwangii]|uniref:5-methylcytosine-specific restriction enzyme subunit McrC n=1 Tax=Prauserella shujinwangii TaxID=1453103 RepID=A0A2T0M282_9PSEU|nr:restriction endonuclease [Prauserella shujinwangii]PRX50865.1 5-methylcytosine-specific restriction enzyme subunit McrC [Prauserella shujinwangii]